MYQNSLFLHGTIGQSSSSDTTSQNNLPLFHQCFWERLCSLQLVLWIRCPLHFYLVLLLLSIFMVKFLTIPFFVCLLLPALFISQREIALISQCFMCLLGVQCQSKRLILLWSSDQKVTCLGIPSLIVPFTKNIPTEKYSIHPKILVHVSILTSQRGKLGVALPPQIQYPTKWIALDSVADIIAF